MTRLRGRKGATLVLVAILMTVLVGFTGIGIDAARLYVMRAQLQTTADAAAIAAIVEVNDKRPTNATAVAVSYAPKNLVERNTPSIAAGGVEPGTWDYSTNSFTPLGSWTDPALAAVRVTATYPGAYTFARVFGVTTKTVTARAVAAVGFVSTTTCLKPWAVSYQTMLDVLYPPAGTKNPTYNLTAQDIQTLTGMSSPANLITLLNGTTNQLTSGNIAQVQTNTPWNGNNAYRDAITSCSNMPIGPGTILHGDPGAGSGQTANALKALCGVQGSGNNPFPCNVQVKLAMWDQNNGLTGSNLTVRVKYVGVFTVTQFTPGQGPGNPPDQIKGYFNTMASSGAFSANPGPVTGSMALVQ
jgi:Flp pilus assembly protein TadG